MNRIVIADDHPIISESVKNLLEQNLDCTVVAIVSSIDACEELLAECKPDMLLLDVGLSDGNALDRLPAMIRICPEMHVLVFSCYGEPAVIKRSLECGASGYVLKDSPTDKLIEGVRTVSGGAVYLCPLTKEALSRSDIKQESLTQRERDVLKLIVEGLPMKQIADRLDLSFETVHSYTKFLRAKLGVNNTAALVRKALEQRLV